MQTSSSSCSALFVCTAILCWDYHRFTYSFFNITKCTPKPISFKTDLRLIPQNNNNYLKTEKKHLINGFICSKCTPESFIEYNLNISNQCYQQRTRIKLKEYCPYRRIEPSCQCFPSNQPIEPITDWMKALVKPEKGLGNTNRVNDINQSALPSAYVLIGAILFLTLLGGIIGMISYWIKVKSSQFQTSK